ncbi:MAPEG family protein [Microbulbifer sp. 2201CG32-9]|uniref:MAPEG family protein n=1 Tax=Microbulbifer sp. 2201CG32-9 TaxID=3232309 RepID=UPI00345BBA6F
MVYIAGFYAGLSGLLLLALAYRVVRFRRDEKVGVGTGGKHSGAVLVRAHGNAVEYLPTALLLMLIAELNGLEALWLHLLGSALVLGRLLHAYGLTAGRGGYHLGRFWGTIFTWVVIFAFALINIFYVLRAA